MHTKRYGTLMLILLSSLLMTGCAPGTWLGPTLTPTPTQTASPTSTSTSTPLPTETPTVTPIPIPTVIVDVWHALHSGPGQNYARIADLMHGDHLTVLGKAWVWPEYWYFVRVDNTGQEGWINSIFEASGLNNELIPDLQLGNLPPTETPAPTQALPLTVHITLVNKTDYPVEASFTGLYVLQFTLQPGESRAIALPAGPYNYSLISPGIIAQNGSADWQDGFTDTWNLTVE